MPASATLLVHDVLEQDCLQTQAEYEHREQHEPRAEHEPAEQTKTNSYREADYGGDQAEAAQQEKEFKWVVVEDCLDNELKRSHRIAEQVHFRAANAVLIGHRDVRDVATGHEVRQGDRCRETE